MITLSNHNKINLHFSKSNLNISYNGLLDSLPRTNDYSIFKFDDKIGEFEWMINENKYDWKTYIKNNSNDNSNNTEESNNYNVESRFIAPIVNETEYLLHLLRNFDFNEDRNDPNGYISSPVN